MIMVDLLVDTYYYYYPLVNQDNYRKSPFVLGKSTIIGHFQ